MRTIGYRSLLVPVADNPETDRALDVACRLAAERRADITAVAVVEVPPFLPLDAHMHDEETRARMLLQRAAAIGDSYGIHVRERLVRAREAAVAIVEEVRAANCEVVVVGAPRRRSGQVFGRTTSGVLKRAPCRVMVESSPTVGVPLPSAPEWAGVSSSSARSVRARSS